MRLTPIAISLILFHSTPGYTQPTLFPVMTATAYQDTLNLKQYWLSEKLDGIRAIWDGNMLSTRSGRALNAPEWFTQSLPNFAVEGELWGGRGQFHLVQQTVLDHEPTDSAWKHIRFMLFDLPNDSEKYKTRYARLSQLVETINQAHIGVVIQKPIVSQDDLMKQLDTLVSNNAEGVMLKRIDSLYQHGRSTDLIKLKKHLDAEATVIGYRLGKGKFHGLMGALLVQLPDGKTFYLGSGFNEEQRRTPPEIGQKVTFRYNGYTQNGIPKFARFIRQRED